jgi:segregation and condensation protein A
MEPDIYQIQTDFFEGPLDLLLHLIRKNKMNILDITISKITSEYLYYLRNATGINPSREGDFLMTASTLIYIKSRSLLPKISTPDEESPEDKLIHTLIEYDKIQKISKLLQVMEKNTLLLWKREEISENFDNREFNIEEVSTFQLA